MTDKKSDLIPASPSAQAYKVDEDQGDVFTHDDPQSLFADWMGLARDKEPNDPNAMALATVDASGMPDVRVVLLKDLDARGLTFFTNTDSAKGAALAANPVAALCFHWKSIRRQVRFRGAVESVTDGEADEYFAKRARGARIGAWASQQSREMASPDVLKQAVGHMEEKFANGPVPRPENWNGYRLIPHEIEFWVNRPFRLHDRLKFVRHNGESHWQKIWLYP